MDDHCCKSEYYDNVKYVLFVLRLAGVFPYELQESVGPWKRIWSTSISFASVLVYLFACQEFIAYIYRFLTDTMADCSYDVVILLLSGVFIRMGFITIAVSTWHKSRSLKNFLHNWRQFQNDFQTISVFFSPASTRRKSRRALLVGLFASLFFIFTIYAAYGSHPQSFSILSSTVLLLTHNLIPVYWYTNALIVSSVMETFLTEIQHSINIGDYRKFGKFVNLWIRLGSLNEEFQASHENLFLWHLCGNLVTGVFGAYLFVSIWTGQEEWNAHIATFTCLATVFLMNIYIEAAHMIEFKMTSELQNVLVRKNVMNLNPQLLHEMWKFLEVIRTKPPKTDMNGFLTLSRPILFLMSAVTVNATIILRQFAIAETTMEKI